jgi:hypothetical protein
MASSVSLSTTVPQVVRFLTAKLVGSYPHNTLLTLQSALHANLTSHYASSWYPSEPIRGSALRCLTLSPACLPPSPIWNACAAANVQWFTWMQALGNTGFDLFVDPGCVAIRLNAQIITIWPNARVSPTAVGAAPLDGHVKTSAYRSRMTGKTLAQQLVEEDKEEDEQLFHLLNDEIEWTTPIFTPFSIPIRSASPLSEQSRCSSRSSNSSSSGFSHFSGDTASSRTSVTSGSPKSSTSASGQFKQSRRERARQARVFVDTSKKEVTPYDGGKTTVLTGGVMLGGALKSIPGIKPSKMAVADNAMSNSYSRRSVRA